MYNVHYTTYDISYMQHVGSDKCGFSARRVFNYVLIFQHTLVFDYTRLRQQRRGQQCVEKFVTNDKIDVLNDLIMTSTQDDIDTFGFRRDDAFDLRDTITRIHNIIVQRNQDWCIFVGEHVDIFARHARHTYSYEKDAHELKHNCVVCSMNGMLKHARATVSRREQELKTFIGSVLLRGALRERDCRIWE